MKNKHKIAHMKTAFNYAECSAAEKLKVGAIIVKDDRIISIGYNGQPAGWNNNCEDRVYASDDVGAWLDSSEIKKSYPYQETQGDRVVHYKLVTKATVLHAERNALDKLARGHESGLGATLFVTHSPCLECAKSIYGAGIQKVIYKFDYRSADGIAFLKQCNIAVEKIDV